MRIEPGQQLLHCRLIEKIGEGGMGVVWKAVDTTGERFYIARPLTDEPIVQNLAVVLNWTAEFE